MNVMLISYFYGTLIVYLASQGGVEFKGDLDQLRLMVGYYWVSGLIT